MLFSEFSLGDHTLREFDGVKINSLAVWSEAGHSDSHPALGFTDAWS